MSNQRRRAHHERLEDRRYRLAAQFRVDLPQLREQLAAAESDGRDDDAQRLRNRIVYRERLLAREDGRR